MGEIVFEDPAERGWVVHADVARTGRENPGRWMRVGLYKNSGTASSLAQHIKRAYLAAYSPSGSFEAVVRTADGESRVYARYVGSGEADAD